MNTSFKLEQFEGPLDLLLGLIDEEKLNISELALSEVTEQYLHHLDKIEEKKPEDLADFLVVATRLLFLKSRLLLPQFGVEEDEGPSLEEQLRLYKAFVEASKKLNKSWLDSSLRSIFRVEPPKKITGFLPPSNFDLDNLKEAINKLLYRLTPPKALPRTHIDKSISIKEKIDQIRNLLKKGQSTSFSQILSDSKNKTEVIVGFLALLELVKQKTVGLKQSGNFEDILIEKV
ncbi:MAG: segregation/condensation protein A [Candidatus Magasanikiibacteriota bacterium]